MGQHRCLALFALALLAAATSTCSSPGPQSTNTPRPPLPATPRSAAANPPAGGAEGVGELLEEIYFGGGCAECRPFLCLSVPEGISMPALAVRCAPDCDSCSLCIFGSSIRQDEDITIDLHAPKGDYVYSGIFRVVRDERYDNLRPIQVYPTLHASQWDFYLEGLPVVGGVEETDGIIIVEIIFWRPVGLPIGEWYTVVRSASFYAEGMFTVERHERPALSTMPSANINPFESHWHELYSSGELLVIMGASLPPNKDLPLGIYHLDAPSLDGRYVPVHSKSVKTDEQGNLQTSVLIDKTYPSGEYVAIVVTDLEHDTLSWFSVP